MKAPDITAAPTPTPILAGELLVKFVARSGLCSRRWAEQLIKGGNISVNNFIMKNPAYRVQEKDIVRFDKKILQREEFVYLVLNKPPNTLCTAQDPEGRPTIFDVVAHHKLKNMRLYSIGRLDRNTTGAIILTNDGALAQRMAHPSYKTSKTYTVTLSQSADPSKIEQIRRGVQLEDGFVRVDRIISAFGHDMGTFTVTLHSGKNRIIKRIFEQMNLFVKKLERVAFGPITKKGLARGEWRFLTKEELAWLDIKK